MHIKDFDPYAFSRKDIGGVNVFYKNLPWAPCIHISFEISSGGFADPLGKEGLSHFLEHMIMNGSASLPSKTAVRNFSRMHMLNSWNASTSNYATNFTGKCLPEEFDTVFSAMSESVFFPLLGEDDVLHEQKVITEEVWGRFKNTLFLGYLREIMNIQYHGHQRSRIYSPVGWPETIPSITRADVSAYHKEKYVKENLTLFLVGAVKEHHLDVLRKHIGRLPSGTAFVSSSGAVSAPLYPRSERIGSEIGNPTEQVSFSISRAINDTHHEHEAVGAMLQALLRELLLERLRFERSLCYSTSAGITVYRDYAVCGISVQTSQDKVNEAEKEIWNIINEVINGKMRERFVEIHKLTIDQLRSQERLSSTIINECATEYLVRGSIVPLKEMFTQAEKVTYENVQELAKAIYDPAYCFTEIILPDKK